MKSLAVLTTFAGAILVLTIAVTANNVTYGDKRIYDRLLANIVIEKPGKKLCGIQTEIVQYPPKGHINYNIIRTVNIIDRGGSKNFGYAELLEGGPGFRNATIFLKSQKGKPLNFTIEYYSRIYQY